jgi:two-component system chemotaxis response regulator CheB
VDVLFESIAAYFGDRAVLCLLTGMGKDGAEGLLRARQAGALTIAQDESTSVVFGMPGEAVRIGAPERVLPLEQIAPALIWAVQDRRTG